MNLPKYFGQMVEKETIYNYDKIIEKCGIKSGLNWLQYQSITSAIPRHWKTLIRVPGVPNVRKYEYVKDSAKSFRLGIPRVKQE